MSATPPRHFSMLREFHLADFFTLGNAACGVGAILLAMLYVASGRTGHFLFAAALAPAAWVAAPIALAVGFGTYLYHNTLQTNATQMMPAVRGTAVALFAFCLFFGQAIGVSWAGYAFDHVGAAPLLLVPALGLPLAGWGFARAMHRRVST